MSKKTFSKPLISEDTDRTLQVASTLGKMSPDPNIRAGATALDAGRLVGRHIHNEYIRVGGHIRRTKSGKLVRVRPYLRKTGRHIYV